MDARFTEAEKELAGYFTSALGIGAQSYDQGGGHDVFDSDKALARFFVGPLPEAVRTHRVVEWTLERIDAAHRDTLRQCFFPKRVGAGPYQVGFGRIAHLGLEEPAVLRAYARWQAESPKRLATRLVQWLDDEATRPGVPTWWSAAKESAEARLTVALAIYDAARVERMRLQTELAEQAGRRAANALAARMGEPPQSQTRIRVARVRPELKSACDAVRALLAAHADLLEPVEEAS